MIRLFAWPQLSTAAAFVTAVTVVLNPVMPVLPDITVPAVSPPSGEPKSSVTPRRETPAVAAMPALTTAPTPATVPAAVTVSTPVFTPAYPAGPTAAAASPVLPRSGVTVPAIPEELLPAVLTAQPVSAIESTPIVLAHIGDRPRPASRPWLFGQSGPKPLPAAAVTAPGAPPTDGGGASPPGRVRPAGPDSAPRGHRGPAGPS